LKILVVVSPRIQQRFSNLDPTEVTDELDDGETRNVNNYFELKFRENNS
jgi:hypothetical protein